MSITTRRHSSNACPPERLNFLLCSAANLPLLQILEAKPQLANYTAFTTGFNCLHYAAGEFILQVDMACNCKAASYCSFTLLWVTAASSLTLQMDKLTSQSLLSL